MFLYAESRVEEIYGKLDTLTAPAGTATDKYIQACARIKLHFNPMRNRLMEEFYFRSARQGPKEKIEHYVTRLQVLAKFCEFNDVDREIVTQVILTC